jgi:endonuclease YncB( thermonuclease family)
MRAAVLALVLGPIVLAGSYGPATADPIASPRVQVLDGDTIRVDGRRPDVRLVGFNAPETTRAQCEAERDLGEVAARRVRELVAGGGLDLQFVACSCAPGTEGTPSCNYGRRCAVLQARGKDVGAILIAERLAVSFQCGATRCPATPRPWCG